MQIKCFKTRQLYTNKMFQNETIIYGIKCFKTRHVSKRENYIRIKCFKTRQLYTNKMFQNETIIYE